jgi:hypothetical protein
MKGFRVLAISLAFITLVTASVSALDFTKYPSAFKQGSKVVQLGIGAGTALYGNTVVPPLSASIDVAVPISDLPFSFGGLIGFTSSQDTYRYDSNNKYTYDYSVFAIGGRSAYHFNFDVKNLDTYLGLMLGYYIVNSRYTGTGSYSSVSGSAGGSTFAWSGYIGGRYFLKPTLGAFAELGAGFTYLTAGVAIKL